MNKADAVFVRNIFQSDSFCFTIEWTDGKISTYRLSDLQKNCTCARCRDETTGRILVDPHLLDKEVQAVRICNVGRYALRIEFKSGCSRGIFTYSFLRQFVC
jgi:DUF971 family protein